MRRLLAVLLLLLTGCGGDTAAARAPTLSPLATANAIFSGASPSTTSASMPSFDHIAVIVMENSAYEEVYHNSDWPYLNQLGAANTMATNYYAITHPSLPNYLALLGGSTFNVTSDCTTCYVSAPNLVDQLESKRKSWKAYMEDLPAPCSAVASSGDYAKKHDPFVYFDDIRNNRQRCANVVPLTQLQSDLTNGHLPDFVWITPNLCHDKHDCSASVADAWLASFVPTLLQSPAFGQKGALFITFDEGEGADQSAGCCGLAAGGRVLTVVAGASAKQGASIDIAYDHYSLLRTIEDAWGLAHLAGAGNAATENMAACFR